MNSQMKEHLGFIQAIITRMNQNSFSIKNWTIVVVTGLLMYYSQATFDNQILNYIGIVPILFFWGLDAMYLRHERQFRNIYNEIIKNGYGEQISPFEMPIDKFSDKNCRYINVLINRTVLYFYAPLLVLIITVGILL